MQFLQGPLTAVLCLSLLSQPVAFADSDKPAPKHGARAEYRSTQLQGDKRILHALNRLTFGPRPGDLEAARAMGLDKWFNQQLHPESIENVDLRARLAEFPAMQWSPEEMLFRVPSNAIIRQALDGKLPVPERGALHAVYEDQMFRVSEKRQEKAAAKQNQPADAKPAGKDVAAGEMAPTMQSGNPQQTSPAD